MADPSPLRFDWERVVRASQMEPTTKLVALLLGTYASKDGSNVRPGLKRLSAHTGLSTRSMNRALVSLRSLGFLDRVSRGSNIGEVRADVYQLVIPTVPQVPPTSPPQVPPTSLVKADQVPNATDQVPNATEIGAMGVSLSNQDQIISHHLSSSQRQVAKLLNLKDDDERLSSIDQMLKINNAQKPAAWIRSLSAEDLLARLDEAHAPVRAAQQRATEANARRCPHGVINGIRAGQCETCVDAAERAAS